MVRFGDIRHFLMNYDFLGLIAPSIANFDFPNIHVDLIPQI